MNYFFNCKSLDEAKSLYHQLAKQYHTDNSQGNEEIMKGINIEYSDFCKNFVTGGKVALGELETVINSIIRCNDITIEIVGAWLWVSGNTFPYRTHLKNVGLKWSSKRKAWYYHKGEQKTRSSKMSMDFIKAKYGCDTVYQGKTREYKKVGVM